MDIALQIIKNKVEKTVWDKRDGSVRILDKSDLCPISGNWLIPANCTEKEPPQVEEGFNIFFEENDWHIEKTKEQEAKEIQESVVDILQNQISELKQQLEELKNEKKEVRDDITTERIEAQSQILDLLQEVEELKKEKEEVKQEISSARAEVLELSAKFILQKKAGEENGLETNI